MVLLDGALLHWTTNRDDLTLLFSCLLFVATLILGISLYWNYGSLRQLQITTTRSVAKRLEDVTLLGLTVKSDLCLGK